MKENILQRINELSAEIEALLEERQKHIKHLNNLDKRIKEISCILPELQAILDSDLSDQSSPEEPSSLE